MSKKRVRSPRIEGEVMFQHRMQCCICKKRGHQIHHIDGDPSNTTHENLAFLCREDHEDAGTTARTTKRLTPELVRKFRDDHYAELKAARDARIGNVDRPVQKLSEEALVRASITASALLDVQRIAMGYANGTPEVRRELLDMLIPYADYINLRIAFPLMEFVASAAQLTRSVLTTAECWDLMSVATYYFPYSNSIEEQHQYTDLSTFYFSAGSAIVYDAAIYTRNLNTAVPGLLIMKFMRLMGKRYGLESVIKNFDDSYCTLLAQMERPGRDDLELFIRMLHEFMKEIDQNHLMMPVFSTEIVAAMNAKQLV